MIITDGGKDQTDKKKSLHHTVKELNIQVPVILVTTVQEHFSFTLKMEGFSK